MKFSIVTICKNEGPELRMTCQSVQSQSFRDFEHIFIDGGSDDPTTLAIINEYKTSFSYFVSEPDKGIYNAQNKGLQNAKGEFILFLNAGDSLADSDVLAQVAQSTKMHSADVYYGDMWLENEDGSKILGQMPKEIHLFHMLRSTLWHPVSFIRKNLFDEFGPYNENYKIVSDYEFFLKLVVSKRISFYHLGSTISIFNLRGIGSSKKFEDVHRNERLKVQRELVPWLWRCIFFLSENVRFLSKVPGVTFMFKKMVHKF